MNRLTENKIVLVTRPTRLAELVVRFNTVSQARFYVEHQGASFNARFDADLPCQLLERIQLRSVTRNDGTCLFCLGHRSNHQVQSFGLVEPPDEKDIIPIIAFPKPSGKTWGWIEWSGCQAIESFQTRSNVLRNRIARVRLANHATVQLDDLLANTQVIL